mgnify:CR=1 FL=1
MATVQAFEEERIVVAADRQASGQAIGKRGAKAEALQRRAGEATGDAPGQADVAHRDPQARLEQVAPVGQLPLDGRGLRGV